MEQIVVFQCFTTLILGAALLFLITRMGKIKRELNLRIEQLEAQLDRLMHAIQSQLPATLDALSQADIDPADTVSKATAETVAPAALADATIALDENDVRPTTLVKEAVSAAPAAPTDTLPLANPSPEPLPPTPLPPLLNWFLRTHLMVQIGIVILFIGVAFLLKYVADQGWLSLELRHVIVAAGGVIIAGIGWHLRKRTRSYGLALQGAGLGVVYMTVFFAFRVYGLLPAGIAFGALAVLGALCAGLAVINNARILAFLAMIGAFLAPFLASTGQGSHVALFSYYVVVNLAILAIAWFKAWRSLNLAGFLFTLLAGTAWGATSYHASLFKSTEPFLILFFLFYLAIAILFAVRQPAENGKSRGTNLVDVTLIFGNPLSAFGLQAAIMGHLENGAGWCALILGVLYLVMALLFIRRRAPQYSLLTESFLFLSFFFLALSVPFFWEAQTTAATWAVSGGAWVWLGAHRRRLWTALWGGLVQMGAAAALGWAVLDGMATTPPWFNALYIGLLLISGAAFVSAYYLNQFRKALEKGARSLVALLSVLFLMSALFWWLGGNTWQIVDANMTRPGSWALLVQKGWLTPLLLFYAATALAGDVVGRRLHWPALRIPMLGLLPLLMVLALAQLSLMDHHFALGGWYAWPLALTVGYLLLYRWRPVAAEDGTRAWLGLWHAGTLWLAAFISVWFVNWSVNQRALGQSWSVSAVAVLCALLSLLVMQIVQRGPAWVRNQRSAYLWLGVTPIFLFTLGWLLLLHSGVDGRITPFPYIPLLNPLDLSYLLFFGVLFVWIRRLRLTHASLLYWLWGGLAFCALNLLLARGVHHLAGVDFTLRALYDSPILQTTYAILWGMLALVLMFWGARRTRTSLWSGGATILALTVLKLFLVDLAHSGAIERIISFIGVGLLITVIAYLAPAPIKRAQIDEAYSD